MAGLGTLTELDLSHLHLIVLSVVPETFGNGIFSAPMQTQKTGL